MKKGELTNIAMRDAVLKMPLKELKGMLRDEREALVSLEEKAKETNKTGMEWKKRLEIQLEEVAEKVDSFLEDHSVDNPSIDFISLSSKGSHGRTMRRAGFGGLAYIAALYFGIGETESLWPALLTIPGFIGVKKYWNAMVDGYANGEYVRNEKLLTVPIAQDGILLPTIGHEYAHHVLTEKLEFVRTENGLLQRKYFGLQEGFAHGIMREIGRQYAAERENIRYELDGQRFLYGFLKHAYQWRCVWDRKKEDKSLTNIKTKIDKVEKQYRRKKYCPSHYTLGNVIFLQKEKQEGIQQTYQNVLKVA